MPRRRLPALKLAALPMAVLLALAGCAVPPSPEPLTGVLTVYASTSLTEPFTSMANGFETTYPTVNVEVTFAPDSELARRSATGPAPDVLAVEGPAPLAAAGPMGPPLRFASNQFVLAVAATNPKHLFQLADIGRPDVRVVLCADTEPCGRVASDVLAAANVPVPAAAQRVPDVRSAVARIREGSADAALVYRSDARLAGDSVDTVEFPESHAALAEYVAAISQSAPNRRAADAFLEYLGSSTTTDALTNSGFQPP